MSTSNGENDAGGSKKKAPDRDKLRQARFREKNKLSDDYEDFRRKESDRVTKYNQNKKKNMSEAEVEERRRYNAAKAKKARDKKKAEKAAQLAEADDNNNNNNNLTVSNSLFGQVGAYKTAQSAGKAIKRVADELPKSPRKKTQVIKVLAERAGFEVNLPPNPLNVLAEAANMHMTETRAQIQAERMERERLVEEFFLQPDVVYTAPGMRDVITVTNSDGTKEKKRKYFLTMYLHEAYNKFKGKNFVGRFEIPQHQCF